MFSDIWRHFAEVLVQVSSSEHRYDTTRLSVSKIQVEGLFRDCYQLGYSDNCNQFWLLFHQKKPRLVLNLLLYPRDCLWLCTVVRVCGISLLFIICDIADISHRMTSELVINQHWISSQSYYLFFLTRE